MLLAQRETGAVAKKAVIAIALASVVVVGGVVGLGLVLARDDKNAASGRTPSQPTAQATAQGTGQATSAPASAAGCTAPPEIPSDQRTRTLPDKTTAAGKTFIATVTTNCGVITMELDGTKAPQTVASFLSLAKSATGPTARVTA